MQGRYKLDNVDLYLQYGLIVLNSIGELDVPMVKKRHEVDWPDDHGIDIYPADVFYEPKDIILECMIKQSTSALAISKFRALQQLLATTSLKQLITYKDSPRAHMVLLNDGIRVERFDGGKTLLFKLKFLEPIPHGRQYLITGPCSVTMQFETYYPLDIYYGDGTSLLNVTQESNPGRSYPAGSFTLVFSGAIEKAHAFGITGGTEI
jgi:hypothetical protein